MRIGVITIEAGHNYGAVLQCYAFQKILKDKGNDVEFLRVIPAKVSLLTVIWSKIMTEGLRGVFKRKRTSFELDPDECAEMDAIFDGFRTEYFKLSPLLTGDKVGDYANKHYDAIIVGSDQVWTWLYNKTNSTFVGWEPRFHGNIVSYSSCSAFSRLIDPFRSAEIKKYLSRFKYISVRDETTKALVRNITGKSVDVVPDPSELYDYEEFVAGDRIIKEQYALVYVLGSQIQGGHIEAIDKIKKQYGNLKIIGVKTANKKTGVHAIADLMIDNLKPEHWLNLIYHSVAVYTDSFHAILFSMKFKKPFLAYYSDSIRASRLMELRSVYPTATIVNNTSQVSQINVVENYPKKTCFFLDKAVCFL